jgi:hypothetical protein
LSCGGVTNCTAVSDCEGGTIAAPANFTTAPLKFAPLTVIVLRRRWVRVTV